MKNVKAAINHFINDTEHGEAWKKILLYAPERAGVRIICLMYYSFHKHNLTEEELDEYGLLLAESCDKSASEIAAE